MSYSVTLMTPLLDMMGVPVSERLPFCCEFESLKDLRDEYIRYCPRTFVYNDIQGSKIDEGGATVDGDDDSGGGGGSAGINMAQRAARFAKEILELAEERDQEEEGGNKKADREAHAEWAKEEVLEGERGCGDRR